jgi:hypothetical protein
LEAAVEKRQFNDPLVQPVEVWLDQLPLDREWLDELVNDGLVKRDLAEADFLVMKGLLERLDSMRETGSRIDISDRKIFFLFHCTGTMGFIDPDVLEYERIKVLPLFFDQDDGTFLPFAAALLDTIKAYAGTNKNFGEQYRRILTKHRNSGSVKKRMEIYLSRYPLELTAEFEGVPAARLDRDLLPLLYWGPGVYEAFYRIVREGKDAAACDHLPRWNGGGAYLPFAGYAMMTRNIEILNALFEGADVLERIRCFAGMLDSIGEGRQGYFENWLDKAIVQDFYRADEGFSRYRPCEGMEINPSECQKKNMFLKFIGGTIKKNKSGEVLQAVRLFFPNVMNGMPDRVIQNILSLYRGTGKEYRRFVDIVAKTAASFEPGLLIPPETFSYKGGGMDSVVFDIIEGYLELVRPDNQRDVIVLAGFICNALDNEAQGVPHPLKWLETHPRFGDLIAGYIDDPGFLFRLLKIPEEADSDFYVRSFWVNYIFTLWFLHTHGDTPRKLVWPVRTKSSGDRFDGPEEGSLLYRAAKILLSEGAIRKEPALTGFIWRLFEQDKGIYINRDFIPYKYFLRVNGDEEKDRLLLEKADSTLKKETAVLRRLKIRGSFDAADFVLNLGVDELASLPQEFFDLHQLNPAEIFFLYLRERGDTFAHFEKITDAFIPFGPNPLAGAEQKLMDGHGAYYIDNAVNEDGGGYLELYKFLVLYCFAGESMNRTLDEGPEKERALLDRCGKHLALLRRIEKEAISPEEKKYNYQTSFYAARFISERSSCWKGLKPFLLALRNSGRVLLKENLVPVLENKENFATGILKLLYMQKDEEKLKLLRRDMADGITDLLKPLPPKDRGNPRDREQNYGATEKELEGFAAAYREPNPHWRYAYVRALGDLGVDADGKGHFFHSLLEQAAEHDPSPLVRDAAAKTAARLRKIRGGWEDGSHRRHLILAFWWFRRAHMLTLDSPINEKEALRTRNTEYR